MNNLGNKFEGGVEMKRKLRLKKNIADKIKLAKERDDISTSNMAKEYFSMPSLFELQYFDVSDDGITYRTPEEQEKYEEKMKKIHTEVAIAIVVAIIAIIAMCMVAYYNHFPANFKF